jgi:hypothetical protein
MDHHVKIDIFVHQDHDRTSSLIGDRLERIEQLVERNFIMTREEAKRLDTITSAIKARIEALIASHVNDLTPAEQAAVDEDFATLDALGKDASNPIPTV